MKGNARAVFVSNLHRIMRLTGKSQSDISKALKIPLSTVSGWYNGASYPRVGSMQDLADYLGVSMRDLTDKPENGSPIAAVNIPLYESVSCGSGGFVDDNILYYISLPSHMLQDSSEYFAQYADGDSMVNAGINQGDLLVFRKTGHIDSGQIGCFCIDEHEAVCKRYRVTASHQILLMPENDAYDPIVVDVETQHFRCLGKLALVISDREKG